MDRIDRILNNVTMYRLLVYGLGALAGLGIVFSLIGRVSFNATAMVISLGVLMASSYATERVLSRRWGVASNAESWLITSLILFLIIPPATSVTTALMLLLAGVVAHASKYLLSWHGRHIFNPAAFGAALLSVAAIEPASWWVGSVVFWPFTLIFGLAVVRKIRRFPMVITFVVLSIALQVTALIMGGHLDVPTLKSVLLASPLIFLSTVMLTEPATMPPRRNQQILFAAIVAIFYVGAWKIGPVYIYPEVALLIGNLYAFTVAPKFKMQLRLREIQQISDNVANYVFQPERRFTFLPGQYMEWTLPDVPYDERGNRRTFTIASSPTEDTVQIGVKHYEPSSAYKTALRELRPGDRIQASQLQGSFTLDGREMRKLAFIAGGIGITPFRSMAKYLVDTQTQADIVLLYAVSDVRELAYLDVFQEAAQIGLRLIPISSQAGEVPAGVAQGTLTRELLAAAIPDYAERQFYVSGPNAMVQTMTRHLGELGIARTAIRTDYFSGY